MRHLKCYDAHDDANSEDHTTHLFPDGPLGGSATTSLMVVRSVAANNATGLIAQFSHATLRVSQSTVTGNTTSWSATTGGILRSYSDNNIDGNGDGDPAPTTIPKK